MRDRPEKSFTGRNALNLWWFKSMATPIRRAGSHGSTSAKMADATFFRQL
jgi:hypothetical protein